MSSALSQSAKESYQLVSFVHAGGAAYYTDWTSDVVFEGNTYQSTPDLEVKWPTNDGLFTEQDCRVAVPRDTGHDGNDTFIDRISNGQPHAEVTCSVVEISRSLRTGPPQSVLRPFTGRVSVVRRNYQGRAKKVLLQCLPVKSRVASVSMGQTNDHICSNILGQGGCGVNMTLSPRRIAVQIASIDGREVTIASNATIAAQIDQLYHRGRMEFEGLSIGVRDWRVATPTKFEMNRQVPAHWVGESVLLFAGCPGSIEACRARHNREEDFNGTGYAMPPYHPSFEDAP